MFCRVVLSTFTLLYKQAPELPLTPGNPPLLFLSKNLTTLGISNATGESYSICLLMTGFFHFAQCYPIFIILRIRKLNL
jgi:hypothetical protein